MVRHENRWTKIPTNQTLFSIHLFYYTTTKCTLSAKSRMITRIVRTWKVKHWISRWNTDRPCATTGFISLCILTGSTRRRSFRFSQLICTGSASYNHSQTLVNCAGRIQKQVHGTFCCNAYIVTNALLVTLLFAIKSFLQTLHDTHHGPIKVTANRLLRTNGVFVQSFNNLTTLLWVPATLRVIIPMLQLVRSRRLSDSSLLQSIRLRASGALTSLSRPSESAAAESRAYPILLNCNFTIWASSTNSSTRFDVLVKRQCPLSAEFENPATCLCKSARLSIFTLAFCSGSVVR